MKAVKVDNQGQITHMVEYNSSELPQSLAKQGYKMLVEQQPPITTLEQDEQCLVYAQLAKYDEQNDCYILTYELKHNTSLLVLKIQQLTQQLASTDYIITKFSEASVVAKTSTSSNLNLEKYDLNAILQERNDIREQIRQLRQLLSVSQNSDKTIV